MNEIAVLEGLCSSTRKEVDRSIVTHLLAIELPHFFSMHSLDAHSEALLQSLHSKLNVERVAQISKQMKSATTDGSKTPLLSLTFALNGKPAVKEKRQGFTEIKYQPSNTMIIGGVLELVAIAKVLGFDHPFNPTRKLTKNDVLKNSDMRQTLAKTPIQITLVFNTDSGLSSNDILQYYSQMNSREPQLKAPLATNMLGRSPIIEYVNGIAKDIELEQYGGIIRSSLRLNKSEQGIVAEGTLIKLVLGAIGGASPQDKNKIEDFNSHKGKFSIHSIERTRPHIIEFFKIWLPGVQEQLKNDRDGFHYSPSLWLALGLIINKISIENPSATKQEITLVADSISQLDYSKSAPHWANCSVMELDAKGSEYKNSSGGGRSFRVGLAHYLYNLSKDS
ncbi:hypothetical protein [Vibrio breoganii]|uniref:hypothetical protein n=1 Tax=Vibrio breoganii TaxID=553239 RepID=UPI0010557B76|nr:hypothetical protein [Vibrio breoganii]